MVLGLPCWSWGSRLCRRVSVARPTCADAVPRQVLGPLEHARAFGLDRPGVRAILAVTRRHPTHITMDVAAAPLLWVVPLILYLLTFVLTFARRPPLRHALMVRVLPLILIVLVVLCSARIAVMSCLCR